jgi:hypothetical protein
MNDTAPKPISKAQKSQKRVVRGSYYIAHKKDVEAWDRLVASYPDKTSELIRDAIRAYDNQDQLQQAMAGFEKRMAGSFRAMHKRLNQIETAQQINLAFLEVLMRTYYFHTSPVPKEGFSEAVASGERRIKKFMEDVAGMLTAGTGDLAGLSLALNQQLEEYAEDDFPKAKTERV